MSDDIRIAALERRILELEQEIAILRAARLLSPIVVLPAPVYPERPQWPCFPVAPWVGPICSPTAANPLAGQPVITC